MKKILVCAAILAPCFSQALPSYCYAPTVSETHAAACMSPDVEAEDLRYFDLRKRVDATPGAPQAMAELFRPMESVEAQHDKEHLLAWYKKANALLERSLEVAPLSAYRSEYQSIAGAEDARAFVLKYRGHDYEGLVSSALKRGYTADISRLRACVQQANTVIEHERAIGNASGYVNKQTLYAAGEQKVQCQSQLKALWGQCANDSACPSIAEL